ncbi:MAG: hypothetical protein U9Q58_04235 [Pseudomonadota bacterium]|nr:hypothetical protein [Pseudomonadota bacterium]
MRKSSLILLLAMAFVLTTVVAAFSADSICKRCEYQDKDGNELGWTYGLQIKWVDCNPEEQGMICPCPTFDYELGSAQGTLGYTDFCAGGYCDTQSVNGVVMELCECEAVQNGELDTDKPYALRFTIMTPASGVYWTNRNFANPANPHNCDVVNCLGNSVAAPADGSSFVYVSSHEVKNDPPVAGDYCVSSCPDATSVDYALTYRSATAGQVLLRNNNCSADCCFTCSNNAVQSIVTCEATFVTDENPLLLIDMPELIWDPTDPNVALGGVVTVMVELIGECGEICTSSITYCECVVEVGTFSECVKDTTCDLCLPYMVGPGYGWWTGIALTNATKKASDVTITYVADGITLEQAVEVPAKTVTSFLLDGVAGIDTLPAGKPVYAQVKSSASLNAFVMVGNGAEAQGYLGLSGNCCCGVASGLGFCDY